MEDPVSVSFETFDKLAAAQLRNPSSGPDESVGSVAESVVEAVVEKFVLRTGRPLPKIVVLGRNLGFHCKLVDDHGGSAVGVDGGSSVMQLAKRQYPGGTFEQGNLRDLPVAMNAFDGVWAASVLQHIPRSEVSDVLRSAHDALRPGGLLYATVALGDEEGFEHTDAGRIYRAKWDPDQLAKALGAMNFDLLETLDFSATKVGMIYRREY